MKRFICIILSLFIISSFSSCDKSQKPITENQAIDLLDKYYESLRENDFDKYCSCFPEFYVDMIYDEMEEYENDFWTQIQDSFVSLYGEDFEIDYEYVKMERISDEGIEDAKRSMARAFKIGKPNLTAAYQITYNEFVSGSLKSDEFTNLTFVVVKIDDVVYLYDTMYEIDESMFAN